MSTDSAAIMQPAVAITGSAAEAAVVVTPPAPVIAPAPADPNAWIAAIVAKAAQDTVTGSWQAVLADLADARAQLAAHPAQLAALEARIAALEADPAQAAAQDAAGILAALAAHRDAILAEIRALGHAAYGAAGTAEKRYLRYGAFALGAAVLLVGLLLAATGNPYVRANADKVVGIAAICFAFGVDPTK